MWRRCNRCVGRGWIDTRPCHVCKGTGRLRVKPEHAREDDAILGDDGYFHWRDEVGGDSRQDARAHVFAAPPPRVYDLDPALDPYTGRIPEVDEG